MAVITRDRRRVHRLLRPAGLARRRSACCGIRSWRRRPATSTSCSRRSSSSRRPRARRSSAACRSRPGTVFLEEMEISDAELRGRRARHDPRLRHVVARGAGRQVPDRAARAAAGRGRLRLRVPLPRPDRRDRTTLAVVITQSGETADTLAALREAKREGARSLAICNVVGSMATRETDGTVYTHAGPGDRRRLDQGVHVAARRAVPAGAAPRRRCAARCRRRSRSRTSTRCCSCRSCSSRR